MPPLTRMILAGRLLALRSFAPAYADGGGGSGTDPGARLRHNHPTPPISRGDPKHPSRSRAPTAFPHAMSCQPSDDGCTLKLSPLKPLATMRAYELPAKCGLAADVRIECLPRKSRAETKRGFDSRRLHPNRSVPARVSVCSKMKTVSVRKIPRHVRLDRARLPWLLRSASSGSRWSAGARRQRQLSGELILRSSKRCSAVLERFV